MVKYISTFILLTALTGCISLSGKGAEVILVESSRQLPDDCVKIKTVGGASSGPEFASAVMKAEIRLKNRAGKVNANYVKITRKDEIALLGGAILRGDAYICK